MKLIRAAILSMICCVATITAIHAQNSINVVVVDSISKEAIPGAVVHFKNSSIGGATNENGFVHVGPVDDGLRILTITFLGYSTREVEMNFPRKDTSSVTIALFSEAREIDEVIVSSTRTNSRIDDLPVKVEVLGQEDMDEESTIVPGGIGSILGDLSIITIQRTNPVNGNDAVRMQGLDARYTQMLRDGLPLYEGFSGSLGVLAIPPLDLKQVEIIKGSASTLYGGGAIGGLINFISKEPTDSPSVTLTFNQTSIRESNMNLFVAKRNNKIGATLFSGANFKTATDINRDGFAEVPEQRNFILHPRLFFYPSKRITANLGMTLTSDARKGGDMLAIQNGSDSLHPFLLNEQVERTTVDGHLNFQTGAKNEIGFKSAVSWFDRSLKYGDFDFSGKQVSSYSELNSVWREEKHILVVGANLNTDQFQKTSGDTVHFHDYNFTTVGLFAQDDWRLNKKFTVTAGLRVDNNSRYKWFVLPQIGFFYKPAEQLSVRLHYGSGYKVPGLFNVAQPQEYAGLTAITASVKSELSNGLNMDVNYSTLVFGELVVQVNQALYWTTITNPTMLRTDANGNVFVENGEYTLTSLGTDTYVRLQLDEWELYLGYNHTIAQQVGAGTRYNTPFNPQDKLAATLAFEVESKWRMGVEAAYNANQYVFGNVRVPNFWFFAGMVERKFKYGSVVLNCENIGDYRQSKNEPLVLGTTQNPIFTSLWGPVEGRVLNFSVKIAL